MRRESTILEGTGIQICYFSDHFLVSGSSCSFHEADLRSWNVSCTFHSYLTVSSDLLCLLQESDVNAEELSEALLLIKVTF